jgi:deoxyribonuclease-1-like protein
MAGYGGSQAVARLSDALNRKGYRWDYLVSDPTSSSAYKTERYAFLWKTAKLKKVGKGGLEQNYHLQIDREPFVVNFMGGTKVFTVMNFHAITKSKQPETEVKYFKFLPDLYSKYPLMFVGDFNLPQSHSVFGPLKKMGFIPLLKNQKTTLRQTCLSDGCLASEYDNIFYKKSDFKLLKTGVIHFYKQFKSLKEARLISDHVPIYFQFSLN